MREHPQTHKFISGVALTNSPDGLVRETPLILMYGSVGALSPDGLVGETPLEIYEAVGALSPDGLVGETPLIN